MSDPADHARGERTPLVVLMAVRNRCEVTRACLQQVTSQLRRTGTAYHVVVVDDGSTDGTAEMLVGFPEVTVVPATGDLYWGGAMRLAELTARQRFRVFDRLWLNDDAALAADALERVLAAARDTGREAILCAAFHDEQGATTYSGVRRRRTKVGRLPFTLERVEPSSALQEVDAFNGNLVFVPARAGERLGGVDAAFTHHWGDFDYGLRARLAGVPVLLLPGFVGTTRRNSSRGTWLDSALPRRKRWRLLRSTKGYPPREKRVYLERHAGPLWFLQWAGVYAAQTGRILRTPMRPPSRGTTT